MSNRTHTKKLYQDFKGVDWWNKIALIVGSFFAIGLALGVAFYVGASPLMLLEKLPESWQSFCKYPLTGIAFILSAGTIFFLSSFVLSFFLNRGETEKRITLNSIAYSKEQIEELKNLQRKIDNTGLCYVTQRKICRTEIEIENTLNLIQKEQQGEGLV